MPRLIAPLLLVIHLTLAAQPVKLHPSAYTLRLPEGETAFRVDRQQVLIRFSQKLSEEAMSVFFASTGQFLPFERSWILPFPDGVVATFGKTLNEEEYQQQLSQLNNLDAISFAAPVLLYKEKIRQAVYDLFYVKAENIKQLDRLKELAAQLSFTVEKEYFSSIYPCRVTKASAGNAFETARYLQLLDEFPFAEPDFVIWGEPHVNDPSYSQQWHLKNTGTQFTGAIAGADIDIERAWQLTTGIPQIKVAVLDCFGSLAQFTHNDFSFELAYDATGTGFSSTGFQGDAHGINCGGLIGATTNNSLGIAGIAHGARVYAVKVGTITNTSGNWTATGTSITSGIIWAYQNAHIISNSNSLGSSSSLINTAISNCITTGRSGKGAPFFSSSGNNSSTSIGYPASNSNTIAVGASSYNDTRASFSNYSSGLDIVAPGVSTYSTDIAGTSGYSTTDYFYFSGTSAACPVAAGIMALILSADSNLTHTQARAAIETSCEKAGVYSYTTNVNQPAGTWNSEMGYGRVNAYLALLKVWNKAPANDEPSGAIALTPAASCSFVTGELAGATQSLAPVTCGNTSATAAKDVWYSFIPGQPNTTITCTAGSNTDVVLGLYEGSPLAPVLVQCTNARGMNGTEVLYATGLLPSTTYYIRVYDFNENNNTTDFSICVRNTSPITGNSISGSQNACKGSPAAALNGSQPAGAAGILFDGYKSFSDFNNITLSSGWSVPLSEDTLLRGTTMVNSFGRSSPNGVILANNFNVQAGKRAQLQSNEFAPTRTTDTLRFDVAHAAYNASIKDSLIVYAKVGNTFVRVAGWASSSTVQASGITTAPAQTAYFIPNAGQWITKKLVLPPNTVQVRFEFCSGFGNQIYLDRVQVDSSNSSFTYRWLHSTASASSGYTPAPGINNLQTYNPGTLAQNTWFRRVAYSAGYADTSGAVSVSVNPLPSAGFTVNNDAQLLAGNIFLFSDTSAGASSRLWNFGNNTTSTGINPSKTYITAGIYNVSLRVSTSLGCADSAVRSVKVYPNPPSVPANSFVFQSVSANSMTVSWMPGNGQKRLLAVKEGAPVNAIPMNGSTYTPNTQFGSGQQLGTGNYTVLNASQNIVTLSNLQPNTTYHFALFEYFGDSVLSSYQQTGYLTGSNATLLPVTWLSFEARRQDNDVLLDWTTGSERNNRGFTVERSYDGTGFSAIGSVTGKGNSHNPTGYTYTDPGSITNNPGRVLYYRIRQTDHDGRYDYSAVRTVETGPSEPPFYSVYPNPNEGRFTLLLAGKSRGMVSVTDLSGKTVREIPFDQDMTRVTVDGLAPGLYFVKAGPGFITKVLVR